MRKKDVWEFRLELYPAYAESFPDRDYIFILSQHTRENVNHDRRKDCQYFYWRNGSQGQAGRTDPEEVVLRALSCLTSEIERDPVRVEDMASKWNGSQGQAGRTDPKEVVIVTRKQR